jgi:hypothetical protein
MATSCFYLEARNPRLRFIAQDRMNPLKRGPFFCGGERSEASVKAAKRFDAAEKSAPFQWIHPAIFIRAIRQPTQLR